jgi:gas vesicle protein
MMSNRDGFGSGFWLGTLVGGVVGGIVGATIASQRANRLEDTPESESLERERGERRPLKSSRMRSLDRMEVARRSLDDKIGDLNNAIDAVRASIGQVPSDSVDVIPQRDEAEQKSQPTAADLL